MELNHIITLTGKTGKGRNRIREHGDKWRIIMVRPDSFLIESLETGEIRNVNRQNDHDFTLRLTLGK